VPLLRDVLKQRQLPGGGRQLRFHEGGKSVRGMAKGERFLFLRNVIRKRLILCYCHGCGKTTSYDVSKIESFSPTSEPFKSRLTLDNIFAVHR
jgi:hypothetical protein